MNWKLPNVFWLDSGAVTRPKGGGEDGPREQRRKPADNAGAAEHSKLQPCL